MCRFLLLKLFFEYLFRTTMPQLEGSEIRLPGTECQPAQCLIGCVT